MKKTQFYQLYLQFAFIWLFFFSCTNRYEEKYFKSEERILQFVQNKYDSLASRSITIEKQIFATIGCKNEKCKKNLDSLTFEKKIINGQVNLLIQLLDDRRRFY